MWYFVLECTLYAEIRKVYISKYFWNRPNMYKFIELLCTDSKKMIKKLSMYTEKASVLEKKICQYNDMHLSLFNASHLFTTPPS